MIASGRTRWIGCASLTVAACTVSGCPDTRDSAGRCLGTLAGRPADLAIDPVASEFHRDDDILLDDDAPFTMSYGSGALLVRGELADMPEDRSIGTHDVTAAFFHSFEVQNPEMPRFAGGSMTLTTARADRMGGVLNLEFEDGSALDCSFDLRRAFELDTDD